jgi:hypothetical protein
MEATKMCPELHVRTGCLIPPTTEERTRFQANEAEDEASKAEEAAAAGAATKDLAYLPSVQAQEQAGALSSATEAVAVAVEEAAVAAGADAEAVAVANAGACVTARYSAVRAPPSGGGAPKPIFVANVKASVVEPTKSITELLSLAVEEPRKEAPPLPAEDVVAEEVEGTADATAAAVLAEQAEAAAEAAAAHGS